MGSKTEDSLVLFGTERADISQRLASRLSRDVPEGRSDLIELSGDGSVIAVFCPSSREELEGFDPADAEYAADRTCMAVTPFPPHLPRSGYSSILRKSDFAVELLSKMVKGSFFSASSFSGGESVFWARTGSLLPFFIHNLNNILARIMGNIELAKFSAGNAEKTGAKLEVALEGTEELRDFLDKLATLSTPQNDDPHWTSGNEADLIELGRMSSGSSVEFNFTEDENAPGEIPVPRSSLNSVMGLIISSAVVSVNGCGRIDMTAGGRGDWACFDLKWESNSRGTGLCRDSFESASTLLAMAAASAVHSRMVLMLDLWDDDSGAVTLCVPLKGL